MRNSNKTCLAVLVALSVIVFTYSAGTGKSEMSGVDRIKGASVESVQEESALKGAGPFSGVAIGTFGASPEIMGEYKDKIDQFKKSLISDLQSKKKFKNVITGNKASGNTVIVTGKVIEMHIVDVETRKMKGAWAGKSYMDVYLKLTDASNGKVIKEIVINTYNNPAGAGWSRGATDQSMPEDMGRIVSAYLAAVIPVK